MPRLYPARAPRAHRALGAPRAHRASRALGAARGARRGSTLLAVLAGHGLALWLLLLLVACDSGDGVSRFRLQYEDWYAAHPPSTSPPPSADLALLERHRPVYWLAAEADRPIAFYEDYIAHGTLYDGNGAVLAEGPGRALLNRHARDTGALFIHAPPEDGGAARTGVSAREGGAPVYGRVRRAQTELLGAERDLVFLTYTLVFARSGLPAGLAWWQEWAARIFADPDDWHQLDHYINTTIVLDESDGLAPIAVEFQHHNYTRTWRLGGAQGPGRLAWPESRRLEVDIALRSNEAYPHEGGPRVWPAASFMSDKVARWMVLGDTSERIMNGSYDHTAPSVRLDLPLAVLAPDDAFYTFRGSLGARRRLPGRSGPPGADYNTFAAFKSPEVSLLISYWREGLAPWVETVSTTFQAAWEGRPFSLDPFRRFFEDDWNGV